LVNGSEPTEHLGYTASIQILERSREQIRIVSIKKI